MAAEISSIQDGPRLMLKNLKGRKAAPFRKGKKRRAKIVAAKSALKRINSGPGY